MENSPAADIFETTRLLKAWIEGDETALERLVPLVEAEMRQLKRRYLRQERPGHILQTTALVNEAWAPLIKWPDLSWQNRAHFIGLAAQLMRRVLVDEARRRQARKYGADAAHVLITNAEGIAHGKSADMVALDDALNELATFDERRSKIVAQRFFGGLSLELLGSGSVSAARRVTAAQWRCRCRNREVFPFRPQIT